MDAVWQELERAGVPLGAARPRSTSPPAGAAIRHALAVLADAPHAIGAAQADAVLAWIGAVRRHWPSRAPELIGPDGERLRRWLQARPIDTGRYLTLRRIAIENLAARL